MRPEFDIAAFKKAIEEIQKQRDEEIRRNPGLIPKIGRCPNCDYCPCCGRPRSYRPYYPGSDGVWC